MRVKLLDPPAYSLPYDFSLAAALARAGADVELVTSPFRHGPMPPAEGFSVRQEFYPRAGGRLLRLAEHVPGMLRNRRTGADIAHYQWLTLEALDAHLMATDAPRVFTSHNVLRRGHGRLRHWAARAVLSRSDAVVTHTAAGGRALVEDFGAAADRVHVIPHGALDYLTRLAHEEALAPELASVEEPVILCFGLLRPYKGIDVLIEAFASVSGAELWVVGRPMMDIRPLREAAGGAVRFIDRFVSDPEIPAFFRRADVVVLPYRRIDQSGVLYTALAFGKAMVLSDVGGFSEIEAARLVAPGDPAALAAELQQLIDDPAARAELEARARAAAEGPYSWEEIARRTLAVYEGVL